MKDRTREKHNLLVTTLVAQEIENEDFELLLKTSGLKVSHYFTVCGEKALSGVGESLD